MPTIRSSADLRNHYNEIAEICHKYQEPVFITKNGRGDLAVMSIEAYEQLAGEFEMFQMICKGLQEEEAGKTAPFDEAMEAIRRSHDEQCKAV